MKTEIKLPVKAKLNLIEDADGLCIIDTNTTGFPFEQCCAHAKQVAHAINCHDKLVEALNRHIDHECECTECRKDRNVHKLAKGDAQ